MKNTELTTKDRLLRTIKGLDTDHISWSPFLAYYWESLPVEIQNRGQVDFLQQIGADPLLRGFHELSTVNYKNCTISTKTAGNQKTIIYETKVGMLTEVYTYAADSGTWFLTGHPVKSEEDFKILQYLYENMEISENYTEFERDYSHLGDTGLYLPVIGTKCKTAFQALVEHWCGTVDLTYSLYDFPEIVEECLEIMKQKDLETVKIAARSCAEGFIFWEDSSTTNISPDYFQKYTAPIINEWGKLLHSHDKLLIHHACGHLLDLLPLMAQTEIDMIESISPPPTGNVDIPQAFSFLTDKIGLIGGIEPTFFLNCSIEDLEERIHLLLSASKDKKFILANSDSCPPGVAYEKFIFTGKLVKNLNTLG